MLKKVLIGYASGWGAQIRETELGPKALQDFLQNKEEYQWGGIVYPKYSYNNYTVKTPLDAEPLVYDHVKRLAEHTSKAVNHQKFPVVVGGDHASAIGTWSGIISSLQAEGEFGMIWIDAHMDSHTIATSPSGGTYHGMPIAILLGHGKDKFINLASNKIKISPKHICLIGVRSYEKGEEDLLEKLGVRVYKMQEVQERGFDEVYKESLEIVKSGTKGYGVSIDLDAFDPEDAPGVGSRESGGLRKEDVLPSLKNACIDSKLKGLEIAEYNPKRDIKNKTAILVEDIMETFFIEKNN